MYRQHNTLYTLDSSLHTHLGVESSVDCTVQIKSASLSSRRQDALFVLLDGGRSREAPQALKPIMKDIFVEELAKDEKELKEGHQPTDTLQYMSYTFLTAHRYNIVYHYQCMYTIINACYTVMYWYIG